MSNHNPRHVVTIILLVLGFSGITFYVYRNTHAYLTGPRLTVYAPQNGESFASTSPLISVRGHANNITFLTINGRQTFTDEYGEFVYPLLLPVGYTIITVEALGKFNRSVTKSLTVLSQ